MPPSQTVLGRMLWRRCRAFQEMSFGQSRNTLLRRLGPSTRKTSKRQKPAGIMVYASIASDSSNSSLVFIDEMIKVHSRIYKQMLEKCILLSGNIC